mmetsp:Transcript_9714/g.13737  ORF Transcript_9714/g.13737 Transcript_9714/m.13737 type:complete len:1135 (+) Transcript_9714:72-3476(+)|eukprot:CAMPEP_0184864592 /NCGR_PEP_ID=MMETSP0580-20130426/15550_1 /TAXON_ID=1118495 /ORGANISM="Dactyliosolen fragilissimus" /LENGTH=1134 /DNA_ID=CAMNT_0027363461 /DNA_START=67 /DNA_END=3471 /DNA_ORIENTATION=+
MTEAAEAIDLCDSDSEFSLCNQEVRPCVDIHKTEIINEGVKKNRNSGIESSGSTNQMDKENLSKILSDSSLDTSGDSDDDTEFPNYFRINDEPKRSDSSPHIVKIPERTREDRSSSVESSSNVCRLKPKDVMKRYDLSCHSRISSLLDDSSNGDSCHEVSKKVSNGIHKDVDDMEILEDHSSSSSDSEPVESVKCDEEQREKRGKILLSTTSATNFTLQKNTLFHKDQFKPENSTLFIDLLSSENDDDDIKPSPQHKKKASNEDISIDTTSSIDTQKLEVTFNNQSSGSFHQSSDDDESTYSDLLSPPVFAKKRKINSTVSALEQRKNCSWHVSKSDIHSQSQIIHQGIKKANVPTIHIDLNSNDDDTISENVPTSKNLKIPLTEQTEIIEHLSTSKTAEPNNKHNNASTLSPHKPNDLANQNDFTPVPNKVPFRNQKSEGHDLVTPKQMSFTPKIPSKTISANDKTSTTTPNNPPSTFKIGKTTPTPKLPITNQFGGKLYPDIRHQLIKALISHAKQTRRATYQRKAMDASIRAIYILAIHPFPIRTSEAASRIKGIGSELLTVLKDTEKACKGKPYNPPLGKFSAVAAAALVSLLNFEEESEEGALCSMEELIVRINMLTHNPTSSGGVVMKKNVEYYLDKNNLDPGWAQVRKLCGSKVYSDIHPFMKERKKKDLSKSGIGYELLERGREKAKELKSMMNKGNHPPGPLRQLASHFVDEKFGDVTMTMDYREGGGGSKSLHKMCDLLDEYKVPYVVRDLKISDYVFFVGNKLAPILIERKSVDDVANSLADGRWERQQRNMRKAQYILGNGDERKCQICYLIEGDASKRTVHGGNIGRVSWNQSLEDVESAIGKLPILGFSVMKSKSVMGSMNILSQVACDVSWKAKNGSIDCKYSYDEFIRKINSCDETKGDAPCDKRHQNPAPPVVDGSCAQSLNTIDLPGDENIERHNTLNSVDMKEQITELNKLSIAKLKEMCKDRDEKMTGKKDALISRLLKKRKPEVLITRSRQGEYVPKIPSSNAAILVAILLNHVPGAEGLTKDKIMMLAEETGISKDPMTGNGGWYDGWAGVKELMKGDPALLCTSKRKYRLTTQPPGSAGVEIASALHIMAHRENLCRCGNHMMDSSMDERN